MGLNNTIQALSNINALLGSTVGFINDRQDNMPLGYALSNMSYNIMNGTLRNAMSQDIWHNTGSYVGYAINNAAGYGSPEANYFGTVGTINAAMMSSFLNPCYNTSSIYGCGPFGYGNFWGRGCNCNTGFMFGGPSLFGMRGYLC